MRLSAISLSTCCFCLAALVRPGSASFYDNPEVEVRPETEIPLEQLKAKWDFDVSRVTTSPSFPSIFKSASKVVTDEENETGEKKSREARLNFWDSI
jgi:hypothetical protein